MSTVILTEKRDQAEKIAKVLKFKQGQGCFEGTYQGQKAVIVWARGHLITLQSPDEVVPGLPWDNPSALVPIPTQFPRKITDDVKGAAPASQPRNYVKNIERHIKGCKLFVISTDSDREGEAIGWEVLEYLGYKGPVMRAWLAKGLDEKSLTEAFSNLRKPEITKSWFRASESRARSDWAFMFLVRAYTHFARYNAFGPVLGAGRGREGVVSVGRVQTPTLAMIVRREREIRDFVPVDHFKVSGDFKLTAGQLTASYRPQVTPEAIESQPNGVVWEPQPPKQDGTPVLDKPLFTDKKAVEAFKGRLMAVAGQGRVTGYKARTKQEQPPKTFSLTDAQAVIGKSLKIPAALVQTIMEDLYEQGWTSYPRTAKSELPSNLYEPEERNGMLDAVKGLPGVRDAATRAQAIHNGKDSVKPFVPKIFVDKAMEHHGIVPTAQVMSPQAFANLTPRKAEKGAPKHTREQMQQAYLMVARQFIQALYPAAQWAVQEMDIEVPAVDLLGAPTAVFSTKGERLIEPGWRGAFGEGLDKDTSIPEARAKDAATLTAVTLATAKTTAPQRYTDVTLPKAMENVGREVRDAELRKRLKDSEGIGTPATRSKIIETLVVRNYVEVRRGAYYATPKGEALIDTVPEWLSSPETTAMWEDTLVQLCEEKDDRKALAVRDQFVAGQIDRLESLIRGLSSTYQGKLSDRPIAAAPSQVSPKMKAAIKSIADRKGVKLAKGLLSDPAKAKAFLDEHIGGRQQGEAGAPSPAALAFARKLATHVPEGFEVPADLETSRESCSKFIDAAKAYQPPTDGQRKYAEKLLAEMPEDQRPDLSFLTSGARVSTFINERLRKTNSAQGGTSTGGSRPSGGGKSGSTPRKPAAAARGRSGGGFPSSTRAR